MMSDRRFREAVAIYKQKEKNQESREIFKKFAQNYGHRKYDLYSYRKQFNTKNNPLQIGSRINQQLAKRVFCFGKII